MKWNVKCIDTDGKTYYREYDDRDIPPKVGDSIKVLTLAKQYVSVAEMSTSSQMLTVYTGTYSVEYDYSGDTPDNHEVLSGPN